MICYVTKLESNQVLGRYPVPPMTVFAGILTDAQRDALAARPVGDLREELIITDDPVLLEARFVFDDPTPATQPPPDAPQ